MQPIDLGRLERPDPARADARALAIVTALSFAASLALAIAFGASAMRDIARAETAACAPAPASDIPAEARHALARLIERD